MNHFPIGSAIWLACFCFAPAPPTVTAPAEAPVYVPVPVVVVGGTPNSAALFEVTPAPAWERQTDTNYEFTGPPGTYGVTAIYVEIVNGKPKLMKLKATVKIIGVGPKPPDPDPDPPPVDTLVLQLTAMLASEQAPDKLALRDVFVAFYEAASKLPEQKDAAGVYTYATYGQLFATLTADSRARGMAGKLPFVRTVTTKYLDSVLPTTQAGDKAFATAAERAKVAKEFARVGKALEAVK